MIKVFESLQYYSLTAASCPNDCPQDALTIYESTDISDNNVLSGIALKCCAVLNDADAAMDIFNSIPGDSKNAASVCAMMRVLVENGQFEDALNIHHDHIDIADARCRTMAIKACAQMDDGHRRAIAIYDHAVSTGTVDLGLKHSMIHFYGKHKCLEGAEEVLMSIDKTDRDAVTVGSMMTVYMNDGRYSEALQFYRDHHSIVNDICTMMALKTCVFLDDYDAGLNVILIQSIHDDSFSADDRSEDNIQLQNTFVHFYGHFLDVSAAEKTFESIPDHRKTIVSITTMMDCYCKKEMYSQCIDLMMTLLKDPKWKHIEPVPICIAMALTAVINMECFEVGQEIYGHLCHDCNLQWMLTDSDVLTNLITMYGKSGSISVCKQLFEGAGSQHVDVWNAMINCYGICGYLDEAVALFERMCSDDGMEPNRYSYIMLFNAYGHHGQMDDCQRVWERIGDVAIKYDSHVMGSIVDGFARMARLNTAIDWIVEFERFHKRNGSTEWKDSGRSKAMWISVLSACRTYGNSLLGEHVSRETLKRFPDEESAVLALRDKLNVCSRHHA